MYLNLNVFFVSYSHIMHSTISRVSRLIPYIFPNFQSNNHRHVRRRSLQKILYVIRWHRARSHMPPLVLVSLAVALFFSPFFSQRLKFRLIDKGRARMCSHYCRENLWPDSTYRFIWTSPFSFSALSLSLSLLFSTHRLLVYKSKRNSG